LTTGERIKEIRNKLGISQVQVSRIEKRILEKTEEASKTLNTI
jgi:DNA-directed RNA polymerase specialized sigma subunit